MVSNNKTRRKKVRRSCVRILGEVILIIHTIKSMSNTTLTGLQYRVLFDTDSKDTWNNC